MIVQTFISWFIGWIKEWLLPKISVATAVWAVSRILYSVDADVWFQGAAKRQFDSIYKSYSNSFYLWLLVAFGAPLLAGIFVRSRKGGPGRRWLWLERLTSKFGMAVNAILGMTFVPLVLATSFFATSTDPAAKQAFCIMLVYVAAFVVIGAGFNWVLVDGSNPQQHMVYTLNPSRVMPAEQAMRETAARLGEHMSYVPFVDKPVIVAHSNDNRITVVLSLRLALKEWGHPEIERLSFFLRAMEREWRCDTGWHFAPANLDELKSGFAEPAIHASALTVGGVAPLPAVR